ncbi:MAG TPA: family 10 glycosylhydrolase [Vicinamibacterales bacterium]|jgi:uncharacterized lipoprotein YddW (UPF0748 family)|nr:family 10 glycosylhydrolase [Vicinamibacterales bacterium]
MARFGACVLLLAAICTLPRGTLNAANPEVRALWVQRGTLTSAPAIVSLVETAKAAGFNTLVVQVRGRGDAFYNSRLEPRGGALAAQHSSFDPLELVVAVAHHAGLGVHAWVNVDLVADADLPAAETHVVYTHPEWLMVPRELSAGLSGLAPRNPEYVATLARYARAHSESVEGLYLSPIQPAAADYTVAVISDIAGRYAVDGIHLDYIRFPNEEFDFSANALAEFRADVLGRSDAAERREYERRAAGRPLFYTQMFPQQWQEFRRDKVTALVARLRSAVKARRQGALLTAAVWPDSAEAASHRSQDWRAWLDAKLLDAVCPMAYTADPAVFRSQIAAAKQAAGRQPVWAGIGAYRLSPSETLANIEAARRLGAQGVILFSYDNLKTGDYLSKVGREAFK